MTGIYEGMSFFVSCSSKGFCHHSLCLTANKMKKKTKGEREQKKEFPSSPNEAATTLDVIH